MSGEEGRANPDFLSAALKAEGQQFQTFADESPVAEGVRLHLAAIVEGSDDAILSKTLDGIITSWNHGAERLYGYSRDEAIGQPITLIVPPDRHEELSRISARLQQGEAIPTFETVRVRKDGTHIEVSVQISPLRTADGKIIGASTIARDITAQKQAQEDMRRLLEEVQARSLTLETANRVARDILSSRTGLEALRHIAEAARTLAGARYAALGIARPGTTELLEFVTVGLTPAEEAAIGPRPQGHGILGLLLQRTEPLRMDRLSAHPESVGFPANHPPMTAFLGVPVLQGETVLGSLYLTDKENGTGFTEADEAAVQALGAYTAIAIHNLHTLQRQRAMVSDLIYAQEAERKAVAYDLHDGLTQYVMASHAHLETAKRAYRDGKTDRADRHMDQGLQYLSEAVTESRRLVNGLRTLTLDELGLVGTLEYLVSEEKSRAGWEEATFDHDVPNHRFDDTLQTAIFRVAQEALTNARKYAETSKVAVSLWTATESHTGHPHLVLEVRDWGKGFVVEERLQERGRVGLHSMNDRVELLGGTIHVQSAPGEGTYIRAIFPLLELRTDDHQGGDAPH